MSSDIDRGVRIADKYEIVGPLGHGAYGNVYRAIQHPVERTVALKVISPHAATDEALRARFFREARAIARLNHPGVVTLHDYGDSDGTLYMVMEYVDGTELKTLIKERAPLDPIRAFDYVRQIVTVLVEAHALDLVHRDLKPANIMIVRDAAGEERIKILDFGIAKLLDDRAARFQTQMGTVVGSPSYFSPEQAMGEACGPTADQYSVGVILYEMLTGKKPFVGSSLMALINAHRFESMPALPEELGLPRMVSAFLKRALEKQPGDRFPDARAMLEALDIIMSHLAGTDRPSGQRPVADSGLHAVAPERRRKNTAPLPGLDADEQLQSSDDLASTTATTPEPISGLGQDPPRRPGPRSGGRPLEADAKSPAIGQTAGLMGLRSAHALYNDEAEAALAAVAAEDESAAAPASEEELAGLPGVEVFNASSTIIRAPATKPRSPLKIALIVGGTIVVLGIFGLWLVSKNREATPPVADAAPAAPPPVDAALPVDAAPPVDAALPVDTAVAVDAAPGDGGSDAADAGAADAAPPDAAPVDAAKARPKPVRRRRPRRPPPQLKDPYEKL